MRNSTSPITQQMIDAENARLNRQVQPMSDGNSDLSELIAALTPPAPTGSCADLTNSNALIAGSPWPTGGSMDAPSPAVAGPGSAGTPGTTVASSSPSPAGSTASGTPASSGGNTPTTPALGPGGGGFVRSSACNACGWGRGTQLRGPQFGRGRGARGSPFFGHSNQSGPASQIPNFSCASAKVIPVPVPAAPAPAPVVQTAIPPSPTSCPPQSQCQTGNVCLDIRRGCVDASQVTTDQLVACSQAGYAGNENFFPCVLAQPNLPFLGAPMPNPPPYSSVAAQDVPPPAGQNWGLGGLGCGCESGGVLQVLGIAIGVAAGIYFADWMSKRNWSFEA